MKPSRSVLACLAVIASPLACSPAGADAEAGDAASLPDADAGERGSPPTDAGDATVPPPSTDAGCRVSWNIEKSGDQDPTKLVSEVTGGALTLRIEPNANDGPALYATLEPLIQTADFELEVTYRGFAVLDDDIGAREFKVLLAETPFAPSTYDHAFLSANLSANSSVVTAAIYDGEKATTQIFDERPTTSEISTGTVRIQRRGQELTLQLEAAGKSWSIVGPFTPPSLRLELALVASGNNGGTVAIDRVAIGTPGAPTSIFADDFTCDSRVP
jgi:hypothetical protein